MTDERRSELDAMEQDQEAKRQEHDRELLRAAHDPRVMRGVEAVVRDWIETVSARIADDVSHTNAAQLEHLAQRLVGLGLLDLTEDPDEEVEVLTRDDLGTGDVVVAITIDGSTYHESGTKLIEHREAKGRLRWRRLDPDGPWQEGAPPPSHAASN